MADRNRLFLTTEAPNLPLGMFTRLFRKISTAKLLYFNVSVSCNFHIAITVKIARIDRAFRNVSEIVHCVYPFVNLEYVQIMLRITIFNLFIKNIQ